MAFVTIGSNEYDTYVDLDYADAYLAADLSATAWMLATDDQKSAAIVTMTRLLDRQTWLGVPTDGYATHAFPRTGLVYSDDNNFPVDPDTVPVAVLEACCEGAALLVGGTDLTGTTNTFNQQRLLKAGSVMIENFRTVGPFPRFPPQVQELIGQWLGSGSGAPLVTASGTCGQSIMERMYNVDQGF